MKRGRRGYWSFNCLYVLLPQ